MGNIKQKEDINENPDDNIFVLPVGKSRTQEMRERRQTQEFPGLDDDLKKTLRNIGGTLVRSEEYLPPSSSNAETFTPDELRSKNQHQQDKQVP